MVQIAMVVSLKVSFAWVKGSSHCCTEIIPTTYEKTDRLGQTARRHCTNCHPGARSTAWRDVKTATSALFPRAFQLDQIATV